MKISMFSKIKNYISETILSIVNMFYVFSENSMSQQLLFFENKNMILFNTYLS